MAPAFDLVRGPIRRVMSVKRLSTVDFRFPPQPALDLYCQITFNKHNFSNRRKIPWAENAEVSAA